ncbi:hypothetical protein [uncultured Microbacterium sp.]|uniref:hypothetical protein n=1 Tax=uncultured Microbacterium sp. TaxID=191216 RepID=UPI0025F6B181|nr:hypothetical protein [uncultured Microbacterium sp.]
MPWFRVDDQLHAHPKPNRAGLAAMGLWTLAGSHCMSYLTDGVVERWWVESKPRGVKLAARLVAAGLWHEHPDGWVFHDWEEFQPTREQILAERGAAVERMRKVRANRKANVQPNTQEVDAATLRGANQNGITSLQSVIDSVRKHAHRDIGPEGALQVGLHLIEKAKQHPRNPQMYVTRSISLSPFEVQQFVDERALAVTP